MIVGDCNTYYTGVSLQVAMVNDRIEDVRGEVAGHLVVPIFAKLTNDFVQGSVLELFESTYSRLPSFPYIQ